jgi:molybdate transport system regulatory protein
VAENAETKLRLRNIPMKQQKKKTTGLDPVSQLHNTRHGQIVSPAASGCLDTLQLGQLEDAFRQWAADTSREDVRLSRWRILLIFLLIRYTGAKLSEVLSLDPFRDIDRKNATVVFRNASSSRSVQIAQTLVEEIEKALAEASFKKSMQKMFRVDQAFVRRKFYERTEACGLDKKLGGPEMIRKARAVELMQCNLPLPVVQTILGHSTPNLTSSYVHFSDEEMQHVARLFMEHESTYKTSARNTFFGKITAIHQGDIQSLVETMTVSGHVITAVITNDSCVRLGLHKGRLVSTEIKAPWIILQKENDEQQCSAENRIQGTLERKNQGKIHTEYVVATNEGVSLCAIASTEHAHHFAVGDHVWVLFNSSSVILHTG